MAQLDPNHPTERISQLLPTVKCSTCTRPIPIDKLGDHVCSSAGDTTLIQPPVKAQTPPRPSSNASTRRSPMDMFFTRRRPSANAQDTSVLDNARLISSPSPAPLPSRSAPSLTPSRNGAPSLNSNSVSQPPRPPQRPELAPNVVAPSTIPRPGGSLSINTRTPIAIPSPLDTRSPIPRRPSNPQSPPGAPSPAFRRPSNPSSPIQRHPSVPRPSLDTRPPIQRRPSAPQSPPKAPTSILRRPSDPRSRSQVAQSSNYSNPGDPRSAPMPQPNHHPVRANPSPAPSSYSTTKSPVMPDIDTKSGGAAGMAGVGRRGFAAAARAAMFGSPPASRMQRPSADIPQSTSMEDHRTNTPPLGALDPPAGMSSFIHLAHITC
jgi:PDZ and LIM domain protein 5/6/7